jgi:5,10-methenyltetrahydrofolate synthetase
VEKDSLRAELLGQLSSLSDEQLSLLSFSLTNQLIKFFNTLPELNGQIGAAYLPLKAEIAPVYQELLHQIPLTLAYPVLIQGEMVFGIPQGLPRGSTWMDPPYSLVDPEWIFVPGVGFDLTGARLGRGKGYFDQYLEDSLALRIGLAWSGQIKEKIPVESHDCHMDYIITESFCWDVAEQKRF